MQSVENAQNLSSKWSAYLSTPYGQYMPCTVLVQLEVKKVLEGQLEVKKVRKQLVIKKEMSDFSKKLCELLKELEQTSTIISNPEPISVRTAEIQQQIQDYTAIVGVLKKKESTFKAVRRDIERIISSATRTDDSAISGMKISIERLQTLLSDLNTATSKRGQSLDSMLTLANIFWQGHEAIRKTLDEMSNTLKSLEPPIEPVAIKEQKETLININSEINKNLKSFLENSEQKYDQVGALGADSDQLKKQLELLLNLKTAVDQQKNEAEDVEKQAKVFIEKTPADYAATIKPHLSLKTRFDALTEAILKKQGQLEQALHLKEFESAMASLTGHLDSATKIVNRLTPEALNKLEQNRPEMESLLHDNVLRSEGLAKTWQEKLDGLKTRWDSIEDGDLDHTINIDDDDADVQPIQPPGESF
ncbi:hypothetical protein B566_EDAN014039, partial [Ephemera danica]